VTAEIIAALALVFGILAPSSPTGSGTGNVMWNAALALVVMLAAARAGRFPLVWMLAIAAVRGVEGGGTGTIAGIAAVALAFVIATRGARARGALSMSGAAAGLVGLTALALGPTSGPLLLPVVVGVVALAPVLVAGSLSMDRRWRRRIGAGAGVMIALIVLAGAMAGIAATLARDPLSSAESTARIALRQVTDGDTAAAAIGFSDAARNFDEVHTVTSGPLAWPGRFVPVVAQHLTALREVSAAGADLADAASDAAATADWRTLTAAGGRVNLQAIESMRAPADAAADAAERARSVVAEVDSPWLLGSVASPLRSLEREVADAAEQARLAADGLNVASGLLGGDGGRRYLLALATPGESRNGGGYVGSFGVIRAIDGAISFDSSRSTRDLASDGSRAGDLELPPDWENRYGAMRVGVFPGNLSASPSWPDDAFVAGQIAARNPRVGPVNGVLYADPLALAALLSLTGPVDVPSLDVDLDANNVVQYLLVDQYVRFSADNDQRLDALSDVTGSVFAAIVARPLPGLRQLGEALGPAVAGGHLRLASFGPAAESEFLDAIGLGGAWRTRTGADYLSLRSANMLPTKIDAFMTRSVEVTVDYQPATGEVRSTVRATVTNSAPAGGLPPYIIGNGTLAPKGTNRNLLALYSPLDLETVSIDGAFGGAQSQQEFGGWVYSVPVDIAPGGTVVVTWVLRGAIAPGPDYRLDVLPPALAVPDRMRIAVNGGDPAVVMDGPLEATRRFDVPVAAP